MKANQKVLASALVAAAVCSAVAALARKRSLAKGHPKSGQAGAMPSYPRTATTANTGGAGDATSGAHGDDAPLSVSPP